MAASHFAPACLNHRTAPWRYRTLYSYLFNNVTSVNLPNVKINSGVTFLPEE
uniref:Uncharacterized protein n=1 Tax=Anguilla anguilla TaxID=7936 RepID=A0A0E9PJC4_ANGAN